MTGARSGQTAPPAVSVGLPVYNGEAFLGEALDSLLAQDYGDFELIISDDGSTDATEQICRDVAGRDPRIRYYREEQNRGAAWNFNRVARLARGRYFRWACHDDLCAPTHLRRCVEALESAPPSVALVYTRTIMIDESGTQLRTYDDPLEARSPYPHQRLRQVVQHLTYANPMFGLMRTGMLHQTRLLGRYESSDYVFFAELSLLGEFWEIPEYLFQRRFHPAMSRRANLTPQAIARWFDASSTRRFYFPRTKLLIEHVNAVRRAPITTQERLRSLGVLLRYWIPRNWRGIVKDYVGAVVPRLARYGEASE